MLIDEVDDVIEHGLGLIGHIFVERQNPEKARASINQALSRLGDGVGILFFPEGTRSRDGRLLSFRKGFVHLAIATGLPVVPLVLHGAHQRLPDRSFTLIPGELEVEVLERGLDTFACQDPAVPSQEERELLLPPVVGSLGIGSICLVIPVGSTFADFCSFFANSISSSVY